MSLNTAIRVNKIKYSYASWDEATNQKKHILALDDVAFEVNHGEFIAIVGHNGSGKSTLARHINSLLLPDEGNVVVCGYDTSDEDHLWSVRKSAGMVFQNPDNQLVATIVEDDIAFGPENLGIHRDEIRKRVDEALETVEMTEYKNHAPHMLSGGQKQRIAIAGVIAMHPDIIIFDESTAMLDPEGRIEVLQTAINLNKNENITVLWITHFMDETVNADRIFVMGSGKLQMTGKPRDILLKTKRLRELHLAAPRIVQLVNKLKDNGVKIDSALTVDELAEALCPLL